MHRQGARHAAAAATGAASVCACIFTGKVTATGQSHCTATATGTAGTTGAGTAAAAAAGVSSASACPGQASTAAAQAPALRIRCPAQYAAKRAALLEGGVGRLSVIADFDRTLTTVTVNSQAIPLRGRRARHA